MFVSCSHRHVHFQSLLSVSSKIDLVDRKLEEKSRELAQTPVSVSDGVRDEMDKLRLTRDKLHKQRSLLDDKLHDGSLLSASEERK